MDSRTKFMIDTKLSKFTYEIEKLINQKILIVNKYQDDLVPGAAAAISSALNRLKSDIREIRI